MVLTVAGGDFFGSGRPLHPDHRTVLVDQAWQIEPDDSHLGEVPSSATTAAAG